MGSFAQLREDSNRIGTDYLLTELDTAFTFLELAETTSSSESRQRIRAHALQAYGIADRMQTKVVMEEARKAEFQQKISALKRKLQDLGFPV